MEVPASHTDALAVKAARISNVGSFTAISGWSLFFCLTTIFSLANTLPGTSFFRELNSNFGLIYFSLAIIAFVFFALKVVSRSAGKLAAVLALVQLALVANYFTIIAPLYWSHLGSVASDVGNVPPAVYSQKARSALFVTAADSQALGNVEKLVVSHDVSLLGITGQAGLSFPEQFAGLSKSYSSSVNGPAVAIYSRDGKVIESELSFGDDIRPTAYVELEIDQQKLIVAIASTEFPTSLAAVMSNELVLRRLGTKLRHAEANILAYAAGGLSPFSAQIQKFKKGAFLRHAFEGKGLGGTWPASFPIFGLMIDQLFYRGQLKIVSAERVEVAGSEHLASLVSFSLPIAK